MRRQQLTEAQIAALFDPPTNRRELVRYCTLSEADTVMIRRCRGDHNSRAVPLWLNTPVDRRPRDRSPTRRSLQSQPPPYCIC
jgi:hypothetical protein